MNIGQKIKAERQRQGLTQYALAGDQVSRNMISMIEKGVVSPSLSTLSYIADTLKVPMAFLVSEEEDFLAYEKNKYITKVRNTFRAGKFADTLFFLDKFSAADDEIHFLYTVSAFELGRKNTHAGNLGAAKKYFSVCLSHMDKTVYPLGSVPALLPLYLAIVRNIRSPMLEFSPDDYLKYMKDGCEYEFFKYVTGDAEYPYTVRLYKDHFFARSLMKARQYQKAIDVLLPLEDLKSTDAYSAIAFIGIYSDLETCYKENTDFTQAYRYSTKLRSLMEGLDL